MREGPPGVAASGTVDPAMEGAGQPSVTAGCVSYFLRPVDRWLRWPECALEEEPAWASRCLDDSGD